jgi:hypothetical protein
VLFLAHVIGCYLTWGPGRCCFCSPRHRVSTYFRDEGSNACTIRENVARDVCLSLSGGYGAARLIPRRDYELAELRLNNIEADKLLSPTESTISGLRDSISRAFVVLTAGPDGCRLDTRLNPCVSR